MVPDSDQPIPPFDPAVLADYPPEIAQAAAAFAASRSRTDLRDCLHRMLRFHQIKSVEGPRPLDPTTAPPETPLLAGLALDSLAMAELAFLLEDLWAIHFENDELIALVTLGDLETKLTERLCATE